MFAGPKKKIYVPSIHGKTRPMPIPRKMPLDTKRIEWNEKERPFLKWTIILLMLSAGVGIGYGIFCLLT
jgi:hypothetical protein